VTLHYHEDNPVDLIFTVMHESGHALYEQNLNREWMYQPIGHAASMGVHESMSRFVENMVGRSSEFLRFYYHRLNKITNDAFKSIDTDTFLKTVNLVRPSKIRTQADEVTYSLHVIIRFEIERALFAGKVKVSELPQLWNEKYDEYLGVKIDNDSEGVMQDTHWASGYYGYFPSYALGNVYDGMFLEKLNKIMPTWRQSVGQGKLEPVVGWLRENVHSEASLYDPRDLAQRVTGMKLTAKPFLDYLEKKYSQLFAP
jgi:carboxypeptidase Taq